MGIRLQADKSGRPFVVSVRGESEAAAQGVTPGLLLKSVQGVNIKSVKYQAVIDWIASLEERPISLKFGMPKVTPSQAINKKSKSKKKSEKKSKKHESETKSPKMKKEKKAHRPI